MEPKIPQTDVWPLSRVTGDVAGAYRKMIDGGRIRIKDIWISKKSDLAVFEYFSTEDKERTHRALEALRQS